MNIFQSMENMDLGFLVLKVKANVISGIKTGDKQRYGEAMLLLSLLEVEMDRRGLDKGASQYGPDFIKMATEDN
jgi:hypothetical protein